VTEIIRIGFSGTRDGMTSLQVRALHAYMHGLNRGAIAAAWIEGHHGDCLGADHEFHVLATALGWRTVTHPPVNPSRRAWCRADVILPEKGYLERDRDIALATGELLAAPVSFSPADGAGTWATVGYAVRAGRPATVIRPDGRVARGTEFFPAAA
jgi:hypothetical protein